MTARVQTCWHRHANLPENGVVIELGPGPRHRFYDSVARWHDYSSDHNIVINAAVQALVDDLDTPALRHLAGLSADLPRPEIESVVIDTLDELDLPHPDAAGAPSRDHSSETYGRLPTDTIRFEITRNASEWSHDYELLVFVNDVEMTSKGAGMGMDPFVIVRHGLHAETTGRQIPIARCECGTYGCGSTDVLIRREGDVVHWDWLIEKPATSGATFSADQYDAEVSRITADHTWERPEDTATRLVYNGLDRDHLTAHRLRFSWAARDYSDHSRFQVSLMADEGNFQVFLRFPFTSRTPQSVSTEVITTLASTPSTWTAFFTPVRPGSVGRPSMAGSRWKGISYDRP